MIEIDSLILIYKNKIFKSNPLSQLHLYLMTRKIIRSILLFQIKIIEIKEKLDFQIIKTHAEYLYDDINKLKKAEI